MIVVVDMTLEAPEDRSAVEFFATLGVLFFVGPDLGRWFSGRYGQALWQDGGASPIKTNQTQVRKLMNRLVDLLSFCGSLKSLFRLFSTNDSSSSHDREDQEWNMERYGGDAVEKRDRRGGRWADLHQGPVRGHRLHCSSLSKVRRSVFQSCFSELFSISKLCYQYNLGHQVITKAS